MPTEADTTAPESTDTSSDLETEDPFDRPTPMSTPAENGLAIVGIHPTQEQRGFISGEYVTLENTGDEPLDISGYTISYPESSNTPIYTYSLTLEPGARVYTLSQNGEKATLETSPPGYLRFAGYDEPLLEDDSGTVVVANADGETILRQTYDTIDNNETTITESTSGSTTPTDDAT
jgi:hypothetical protein